MAYLSREPPPPEPLARRAGAAPDTGGRAKGSGINAWLERACRRDRLKLQPDAQLAPLVTALPPADMRLPLTFRPLDEASLRGFELRPVIKRPEQAAAGSADGAAAAAAADPELRAWELAHRVHDVFTDRWPHTWARPTFPADRRNPQPSEYAGYASQLCVGSKCKATLEEWAKLPATAPQIKLEIKELIKLLKAVYTRDKREAAAAAAVAKREEEERVAQDSGAQLQTLLHQKMALLRQTCDAKVSKLQAEADHLGGFKRDANKQALRAQTLKRMQELQLECSTQCAQLQAEAGEAIAAAQALGGAAAEAEAPPMGMELALPSPPAQPPSLKRPRRR